MKKTKRVKGRRLSEDEKDNIVWQVKQGFPMYQICMAHDTTLSTVHRVMSTHYRNRGNNQ